MSTKIPKACEPCRMRKKRCNRIHPCHNPDCQKSPQNCVYRPRARTRRSKRGNSEPVSQLPLLGSVHSVDGKSTGSTPPQWLEHRSIEASEQGVQPEVYHSITETHLSPTPTDSSQLFYGPSSYFAFLQQIHRGIPSATDNGQSEGDNTRSGVDTLMQRSLFFGTPSRISPEAIRSESIQLAPISREMGEEFLQGFKTTSHYRLPFYTIDEYQALTLGRRSSLQLKDITFPIPTEPLPTARLCHIARIMEDAAEAIYGRRATSVRQLYVTAEELRGRLDQFAQDWGIASAQSDTGQGFLEMHESMTLHNLYYHTVILIFRPFLITNHAMRVSGGTGETKDMWLRQACRHAVNAAQDSIEFSSNVGQVCKGSRYQAFFIECSCAVLLYDTICQPSKYSYNMEYIQKAIQELSGMVADEPVISSLNSIRRVLETVEASIFGQDRGTQSLATNITTPRRYSRIHFPSLDYMEVAESGKMILPGETVEREGRSHLLAPGLPDVLTDQDWTNPNHFNLNIMTTDLFNFFPFNLSTPIKHSTGSSLEFS
ncbi:hypothetical protein BKA59DRAFT_400407 [Fusarium tricinctum]|uniref:Zn(2)-C6 fungal-type domain-containing protein n=1 Tax=Fusarium tricinctum TaxID=61284 RepID=A0A8K0WAM0_9HYPO|nr:hypothetical protein BKA59DRAFT_400407 [Fusarium tricinctum]